MSKHKEGKLDYFYRVVAPKLTSIGASVVIIGAMFKILHLPGAGTALGVGLTVEAVLFFMGAFQPAPPPDPHYEWERVYPELADDAAHSGHKKPVVDKTKDNVVAMAGFDKLLAAANLTEDSFKSFGSGIKALNDSASKMKDLTSAVAATDEYTKSLKDASKSMGDLNKSYSTTVSAMSEMANASKEAKEYHVQVQAITKNLSALNAVYEMELKDANSHLKAMNKFYANLTSAMEGMADASKESQVFKEQMTKLTSNLTNLNKVYGNMLTAMKG